LRPPGVCGAVDRHTSRRRRHIPRHPRPGSGSCVEVADRPFSKVRVQPAKARSRGRSGRTLRDGMTGCFAPMAAIGPSGATPPKRTYWETRQQERRRPTIAPSDRSLP
jgi:hypothetical protein